MKLLALALLAILAISNVAHAAEVVVPVGDWFSVLLAWSREIIVAGVGAAFVWMVRKLPAQIGDIIVTMRMEQLLTRAVDYGIAAVAGATKDKAMTIPIANQVIAEAVSYAVKSAPALADKFADTLRAKILARLSANAVLAPEVSAQATTATVPAK